MTILVGSDSAFGHRTERRRWTCVALTDTGLRTRLAWAGGPYGVADEHARADGRMLQADGRGCLGTAVCASQPLGGSRAPAALQRRLDGRTVLLAGHGDTVCTRSVQHLLSRGRRTCMAPTDMHGPTDARGGADSDALAAAAESPVPPSLPPPRLAASHCTGGPN